MTNKIKDILVAYRCRVYQKCLWKLLISYLILTLYSFDLDMYGRLLFICVTCLIHHVTSDYTCVCTFAVDTLIYSNKDTSSPVQGTYSYLCRIILLTIQCCCQCVIVVDVVVAAAAADVAVAVVYIDVVVDDVVAVVVVVVVVVAVNYDVVVVYMVVDDDIIVGVFVQ